MTDFKSFDNIKPKSKFSINSTNSWYSEIKRCIFIFILFLLINSEVFITQILSKFPESTNNIIPNNKGVVIQGLILTMCYLCISILVDQGWV